ncbi:amidase [Amycolatopsis taiwanensis]|uniref:Glutamyl-tRNA(Gln) amidotransferase subunit A n=1 Tax=Amycolatopsis taiwanensis TaxID=342230 RepID=A0A9W6VLC9_9PSEU|nr:amidase [Amycolatopsis taiwanensis]GLY71317.1 glutamyl-tRNA(Gln) amidotransferase subunit A [Amycolatopsis taiwanensis]
MTPVTIEQAAAQVRAGQVASTELVRRSIELADEHDATLGVFLSRFDESALAAAAEADAAVVEGKPLGPLHGVPIGIKDLLATREGPTTAQSLAWDSGWGAEDATAVARLRAAGAVIVGKTTTLEFAYGTPATDDPFPMPANPWDPRRWAGGSSSGSGSGVAAGMMLAALGTDTAGSVRAPAAMCGITGLKPTYGAVPMAGCIPLAFSADHIGPMAHTAKGCSILLEVLTGRPLDRFATDGLTGVRIGVDRLDRITEGTGEAGVSGVFDDALKTLAGLGAEITDVELPLYPELTDTVFISTGVERLAYHAPRLAKNWSKYGRSARAGMLRGAYYSAADYVQAQRVRRHGQHLLARLFDDVDVIVTPTASVAAPLLTEIEDCMAGWKRLVHTTYWNAVGNPVLSVPMGFNADSLPLGLQIAGRPREDATVLHVGEAFQQATAWHLRQPGSKESS